MAEELLMVEELLLVVVFGCGLRPAVSGVSVELLLVVVFGCAGGAEDQSNTCLQSWTWNQGFGGFQR